MQEIKNKWVHLKKVYLRIFLVAGTASAVLLIISNGFNMPVMGVQAICMLVACVGSIICPYAGIVFWIGSYFFMNQFIKGTTDPDDIRNLLYAVRCLLHVAGAVYCFFRSQFNYFQKKEVESYFQERKHERRLEEKLAS